MIRGVALLAVLALVAGCIHEDPGALEPSARRALTTQGPSRTVRVAGSLRAQALAHPTIRVVVEATCPDMAAFHVARSLDAECAVSEAPGETYRAKVSAVRDVRLLREPTAADVYGLITLEVDNRAATILPGRHVVASFDRRVSGPLLLFGAAEAPAP